MTYPTHSHAGRHAWRRVQKAIGAGEAKNLAADIVAYIDADGVTFGLDSADVTESIRFALEGYPWEDKERI